jgi:hypothetical protein
MKKKIPEMFVLSSSTIVRYNRCFFQNLAKCISEFKSLQCGFWLLSFFHSIFEDCLCLSFLMTNFQFFHAKNCPSRPLTKSRNLLYLAFNADVDNENRLRRDFWTEKYHHSDRWRQTINTFLSCFDEYRCRCVSKEEKWRTLRIFIFETVFFYILHAPFGFAKWKNILWELTWN